MSISEKLHARLLATEELSHKVTRKPERTFVTSDQLTNGAMCWTAGDVGSGYTMTACLKARHLEYYEDQLGFVELYPTEEGKE